ncbi:hypothetical protein PBY51_017548 [Eleginops maclovinus]|uniref:Uncharacterized protein n=1 Tax=Eleginops maclovinus TaxID=56733 RepID=A0AAN7XJX5_ELEMC|nr:hypothetical protein PBY51_017548 [Eleginops maclovinus]
MPLLIQCDAAATAVCGQPLQPGASDQPTASPITPTTPTKSGFSKPQVPSEFVLHFVSDRKTSAALLLLGADGGHRLNGASALAVWLEHSALDAA